MQSTALSCITSSLINTHFPLAMYLLPRPRDLSRRRTRPVIRSKVLLPTRPRPIRRLSLSNRLRRLTPSLWLRRRLRPRPPALLPIEPRAAVFTHIHIPITHTHIVSTYSLYHVSFLSPTGSKKRPEDPKTQTQTTKKSQTHPACLAMPAAAELLTPALQKNTTSFPFGGF